MRVSIPFSPRLTPAMARVSKKSQSRIHDALVSAALIGIAEAARRCGWTRANTFRERFLETEEDATAMGLIYDPDGRALVDAAAVAIAVGKVEKQRADRNPGWRIKNLGVHARQRPNVRPAKRKRGRPRKTSKGT